MRKNQVQNVVIHEAQERAVPDKINLFHIDIIERRLNLSGLETQQKLAVIDKILEDLKSRESDGRIE